MFRSSFFYCLFLKTFPYNLLQVMYTLLTVLQTNGTLQLGIHQINFLRLISDFKMFSNSFNFTIFCTITSIILKRDNEKKSQSTSTARNRCSFGKVPVVGVRYIPTSFLIASIASLSEDESGIVICRGRKSTTHSFRFISHYTSRQDAGNGQKNRIVIQRKTERKLS